MFQHDGCYFIWAQSLWVLCVADSKSNFSSRAIEVLILSNFLFIFLINLLLLVGWTACWSYWHNFLQNGKFVRQNRWCCWLLASFGEISNCEPKIIRGPVLKVAVFRYKCNFSLLCTVASFWIWLLSVMIFGSLGFSARSLALALVRKKASEGKSGLIIGIIGTNNLLALFNTLNDFLRNTF